MSTSKVADDGELDEERTVGDADGATTRSGGADGASTRSGGADSRAQVGALVTLHNFCSYSYLGNTWLFKKRKKKKKRSKTTVHI